MINECQTYSNVNSTHPFMISKSLFHQVTLVQWLGDLVLQSTCRLML